MAESFVCGRVLEKCQITHPTKQVYNIWLADYLCDIILDVNGSLFPSAKKVLISACANFKSIEKVAEKLHPNLSLENFLFSDNFVCLTKAVVGQNPLKI